MANYDYYVQDVTTAVAEVHRSGIREARDLERNWIARAAEHQADGHRLRAERCRTRAARYAADAEAVAAQTAAAYVAGINGLADPGGRPEAAAIPLATALRDKLRGACEQASTAWLNRVWWLKKLRLTRAADTAGRRAQRWRDAANTYTGVGLDDLMYEHHGLALPRAH